LKDDLEGNFVDTSRDGFKMALDVSSYSLTAVTRALLPLMNDGGSVITMTYLGGERVVQNYNVMGVAKAALESSVRYLAQDLGPQNIRVNALSAGPLNTLAARGISGFTEMLKYAADKAPMKRNVELEEVANAALFLVSDMSSGITGQTIYVDCGYNIIAM
jgi:enoyl-[acyl-carrier protein] reductase I